ncbi:hypothetical protein M9H77_29676 [Catharanthus roseus]|uniref:Uncharacterized protein n=1 Tax=Catharanthus roseus TaxID=4058 RepID=A0ACB9ZVW1_CATRO|nr:hypothetical protein M9H77_29676 [Catharanthus roseus]
MDELKKARQMVEEPGKIGSDIPEEHHRDMESEMRDLTSLLQKISTCPISNVRKVRRLIKGVIHPVLPNDLSQPLSTSPETAVTKGRRKTNSTKRDKSHLEYVYIAHRKLGKSSGSGPGSGSGSGSGSIPSPRGRGSRFVVVGARAEDVAVVDRVYQPSVVSNFLFGDKNHWVEIQRRMIFDLRHHMRVYEQLFGSVERVTVDNANKLGRWFSATGVLDEHT